MTMPTNLDDDAAAAAQPAVALIEDASDDRGGDLWNGDYERDLAGIAEEDF